MYNKVKSILEQYEKDGDYPKMKKELLILFSVMKCEGCFKEIQNTDCYCEDCYIKHGELQ